MTVTHREHAPIKFQLDEHISTIVARELRRRGIDAVSATEAGLLHAPDQRVMEHARRESRVVVTSDHDFLRMNAEGQSHLGIVHCRQQDLSIGYLVEMLEMIHELKTFDEMIGHVEYI